MPGTPISAIQPPQVLLARIIASDTMRSSGAPRRRSLMVTFSSPLGSLAGDVPSAVSRRKL
jgi:hypothetical protein